MDAKTALEELEDIHANNADIEEAHSRADEILCELLISLGCSDVVTAYRKISKWYA